MAKQALPNWDRYWAKFHDRDELLDIADNIDDQLLHIEKEYGVKLLSGDHILILEALDERIDDLEKLAVAKESPLQASLFDEF
jgi:hypothetical protein